MTATLDTSGFPPAGTVSLLGPAALTPGDRPARSLSPSRANDFMTCPLLYRLRSIDRIPEPPSVEAARGTLVHAVLERLFDVPAGQRTAERAVALMPDAWSAVTQASPELAGLLFGGDQAWATWLEDGSVCEADTDRQAAFLTDCEPFLAKYFALEDPNRLEPAERELAISLELPSGLVLRGVVDRVDRAPDGRLRVVDYKTGRAPGPGWEAKALFQMRFYGLVLWRMTGRLPARLQLLYLNSQERLLVDPTADELLATERKLDALWAAIEKAGSSGDWRPKPSRLCDWCAFRSLCPAQGGTSPPLHP